MFQPNFIDADSDIDWDQVFELRKLIEILRDIGKKYGMKSLVNFDAGYNNVGLLIKPSKKVKQTNSDQ